jgi:hypothetical protein
VAYITLEEAEASKDEDALTDIPGLIAWMQELSDSVPIEEWDALPPDLAEHFEEYKTGRRQFLRNGKSS